MFEWLSKQSVKCDEGYTVQSIGRFETEYSDAEGVVNLYIEYGWSGERAVVMIFSQEILTWKSGKAISAEKKQQILKNFTKAMNFQNLEVEIL